MLHPLLSKPSLAVLRKLKSDEEGGITILGLFLFLGVMMAGGLALDTSNAIKNRAQLQNAADAAAHAALYWTEWKPEEEAKEKAIEVAKANMPVDAFGNILATADVEFGIWDAATRTFTPSPGSITAVRVMARRTAATDNAMGTMLLRMVGLNSFDLYADSVWETFHQGCMREGFVAEGIVDLQSSNTYRDGFCVHSNSHVEINQNNYFEGDNGMGGTIVSMPNSGDIQLPNSGYEQNEGLREALRSGGMNLRLLNQITPIIEQYKDPTSSRQESHIVGTTSTDYILHNSIGSNTKITDGMLTENRVNMFYCGTTGNGTVTIENDVVLENMVIHTDCDIKFNSGAALENTTLITESTGNRSISAPSGFRLGRNDTCGTGGGANIITRGTFDVAAGLEVYGGQIIAEGDILFTANADGIEGASFISGGVISGTSNMDMGFCDNGMETIIEVDYFRMVQ